MTPQPSTLEFEREPCSRCGGCGRYSYNQITGDRCFKCGGRGWTLTKRGVAAHAWHKAQRTVPASQVKVGDRIQSMGLKITVRSIEPQSDGALLFRGQTHSLITASPVEVLPVTNDAKNAALMRSFAYQDTLGKNGKPLKTKEGV